MMKGLMKRREKEVFKKCVMSVSMVKKVQGDTVEGVGEGVLRAHVDGSLRSKR